MKYFSVLLFRLFDACHSNISFTTCSFSNFIFPFLNIFCLQQSIPFLQSFSMGRWNLKLTFQGAVLTFNSETSPQTHSAVKQLNIVRILPLSVTSSENRCLLKFALLFQETQELPTSRNQYPVSGIYT